MEYRPCGQFGPVVFGHRLPHLLNGHARHCGRMEAIPSRPVRFCGSLIHRAGAYRPRSRLKYFDRYSCAFREFEYIDIIWLAISPSDPIIRLRSCVPLRIFTRRVPKCFSGSEYILCALDLIRLVVVNCAREIPVTFDQYFSTSRILSR